MDFRIGDAVKVTDYIGKVFTGTVVKNDGTVVGIKVPAGHTISDHVERGDYVWNFFPSEINGPKQGDYGLRIEPWSEAQPFTVLDDAGRAALKVGDKVLIEMTIQGVDFGDHTVRLTTKHATMSQPWRDLDVVYALLSPAPAIEPGQTVLILGRDTGIVLGQASDGTWAVEYQAGDGVKIGGYDASCLEVQP